MIQVTGLCKRFKEKRVFDHVDVRVENGSVCGLVGINGAGKSTLLRILSGVMQADAGEILIDGQRVYENPEVKKHIFFLPDEPYYDVNLTGDRLRKFYSAFYPFDERIYRSYAEWFSLDLKKPVRNFSKGMKRQLFISAALACKPGYLFLDEAFDGLDPLARLEFKRGLISLQETGSTIVIASHSLRELEDICDSFILIDKERAAIGGKLESALNDIFKLQAAFRDNVLPEPLPFECLRREQTGRVFTLVGRGDKEAAMEALSRFDPVLLEEIPMDFEDMFMEEVVSRGYLK